MIQSIIIGANIHIFFKSKKGLYSLLTSKGGDTPQHRAENKAHEAASGDFVNATISAVLHPECRNSKKRGND